MQNLMAIVRQVWHHLREACGENDYARYRARATGDGAPLLSPTEFYLAQLRQKYSRISRCC